MSGWLLLHFWWGSIFLTNVFVVIVALVAGAFLIPSSSEKRHAPLDPLGAVLSMVGLGALLFGIIEGPSQGWSSTEVLASFAIGIAGMIAFIVWETSTDHPMLESNKPSVFTVVVKSSD